MDRNIKKIGYKPNLEYTDTYESSINITQNKNINPEIPDILEEEFIENNKINDLINNSNNINNGISNLPIEIKNPLLDVFIPVKDFISDELYNKDYGSIPKEEDYHYEEKENDDSNESAGSIWDTEDFFDIVIETNSKEDIIEKEYVKNLSDLFVDYTNNLQKIISNFWINYGVAVSNKTNGEINIINNNILLSSKDVKSNSKHLLDSALREQIYKDYKLDYYKLLFTLEETLKKLNSFKSIKELRLRYVKIKEENGYNKTNQTNNNILKISQLMYDNKYDSAYEDLYRYLNTSNDIINDVLTTWIHEIKSKQILIEKGGII